MHQLNATNFALCMFYRFIGIKGTGNMLKEKLLSPKAAIRICQFKKNFINLF
jgi:hypothetical protein